MKESKLFILKRLFIALTFPIWGFALFIFCSFLIILDLFILWPYNYIINGKSEPMLFPDW